MTIVHAANTKQDIIHIWIMGKIYMLIFYFIPHIEEQKPQMLHSGAVEEEMAISSQYEHWGDAFIFISNNFLLQLIILWTNLNWKDWSFVSCTTLNVLVKISAHSSSCLWCVSFHLWTHVGVIHFLPRNMSYIHFVVNSNGICISYFLFHFKCLKFVLSLIFYCWYHRGNQYCAVHVLFPSRMGLAISFAGTVKEKAGVLFTLPWKCFCCNMWEISSCSLSVCRCKIVISPLLIVFCQLCID